MSREDNRPRSYTERPDDENVLLRGDSNTPALLRKIAASVDGIWKRLKIACEARLIG